MPAFPEAEAGGLQVHSQSGPVYISQEVGTLAAQLDMGSIPGIT